MVLRLPEHWVWDFWPARDGDALHVFFLHAPRALRDPDRRHYAARIGHAVSSDLRTWEVLPEALAPSDGPDFDDRALWTGSVLRHAGRWLMFYTGISQADAGVVQRIGMAISDDLLSWRRTPVRIEADDRWYEKAGEIGSEEHWRDPWAIETADGLVHLLITSRVAGGPPDERGVIGHAWSADLADWTVGPPLSEPGAFGQLEVPQVVEVGDRWHLLASVRNRDHSSQRRSRPDFAPYGGTLTVPAAGPLGPFATGDARMLVGDERGSVYAARIVSWRGAHRLLAWRDAGANGGFVGELTDPIDVGVEGSGYLQVAEDGRGILFPG